MPALRFYTIVFAFAFVIVSCDTPEPKEIKRPDTAPVNEKRVTDQFIQANKQLMQKENDEMDYYARSHKMPFVRTGSGIRYYVYKPSSGGDSLKPGMQVTLEYEVRLLDGTLCYSSKTDGTRTFLI